ncbi:LysR substrate-binding domain-containing protein [Streptomyces erythrochromogenes]|uniref:LysR substrate-binding domain-containing protein n=1 Tax=Streptomyces erythrochromogenes TaxID=285574 RepID=UPI0037FD82F8
MRGVGVRTDHRARQRSAGELRADQFLRQAQRSAQPQRLGHQDHAADRRVDQHQLQRRARTRRAAHGDLAEGVEDPPDRAGQRVAELDALRTLGAGRLRIGSFSTADAALLPRALAAFRARHPAVAVTRTEGPSAKHLALLAAGELDLAVVADTSGRPPRDCTPHHLLDERMYVALPGGHRLARRTGLRLAELADEEWIAAGTRPEETLMHSAPAGGFRPRTGFVAADWIAKQGFVAAGLGVTLVPELAASSVRPDLALVPLHPDDTPRRGVYAATPRGIAPSPAAAALLTLLKEAADGLAS